MEFHPEIELDTPGGCCFVLVVTSPTIDVSAT